jgi:hypothetical protein
MSRNDVHGGTHLKGMLADRLRNARFRLHMSHRRQRQELPLLEDDETPGEGPLEAHEPPRGQ